MIQFGMGYPVRKYNHPMIRGRFCGDPPKPAPPEGEAPPVQKKSFWDRAKKKTAELVQKSVKTTRVLCRKLTSFQEFKKSVAQGVSDSKADLKKTMHSKSTLKIATRIGAEALGLAVFIVFLPAPGPNPGIFISPTGLAFVKGFLKEFPPPAPGSEKTVEDKSSPPDAHPGPAKQDHEPKEND